MNTQMPTHGQHRDDMGWLPKFLVAKFAAWIIVTVVALRFCAGCSPYGGIYAGSTQAMPTIAGNGSMTTTSGLGGMISSRTGTSPDGRAVVAACLNIERDWNEYLRSTGITEPSQATWMSWLRLQQLSTVADRCIDHATYGTPMGAGGGTFGAGMGPFGGRTFKTGEK